MALTLKYQQCDSFIFLDCAFFKNKQDAEYINRKIAYSSLRQLTVFQWLAATDHGAVFGCGLYLESEGAKNGFYTFYSVFFL